MAAKNTDIEIKTERDEQALLSDWAEQLRLPLLSYFQRRAPKTVEPDDLVQEVFIRLAPRADLATIDQIEGYIFQTAARVLADRFRKDQRKIDVIASFDDTAQRDFCGRRGIVFSGVC